MDKKRIGIIIGVIILIVILSFQSKKENTDTTVNSPVVEYDEPLEVSYTSNVFSKCGHILSNLTGKVVEYIFIVINKIVGFVFGI